MSSATVIRPLARDTRVHPLRGEGPDRGRTHTRHRVTRWGLCAVSFVRLGHSPKLPLIFSANSGISVAQPRPRAI